MNTVDMLVKNLSQLIYENCNFLDPPPFFFQRKVTGCPVYYSTPLGIFSKFTKIDIDESPLEE